MSLISPTKFDASTAITDYFYHQAMNVWYSNIQELTQKMNF